MSFRRWQPALVCLVVLALALFAPARRGRARVASVYNVTDLGVLGGDQKSIAYALDGFGRVAGVSILNQNDSASARRPFLWDNSQQPKMADLGTLGGDSATASSLNNFGTAAGNSTTAAGDTHAFVWHDDNGNHASDPGEMKDLGTLSGDVLSTAFGVNDSGQVVGLSESIFLTDRAFVWSNGTMSALAASSNPNNLRPIAAYAVNNAGQIVGVAATSTGASHAYRLNGGTLTDLGTLGGRNSFANGINEAGMVVGNAELSANSASPAQHAFVWNDADADNVSDPGEMKDLGALAGGTNSIAYDINASGQVVGSSEVTGGSTHAFVTVSGTMTDLNSLIPSGTGWTLQEARSINDGGQIVGYGLFQPDPNQPAQTHAFLLTPASFASSSVSNVSGSGVYNSTATLTATLTSGGSPLSNQTVGFALNGAPVCGVSGRPACPSTDAGGVATLTGVDLSGINVGTYPNVVAANFSGAPGIEGSSGAGQLTVDKADQTITFGALADKTFGDSDFPVSATASSGLSVGFAASGNCTVSGSTVHITGAGPCTITASQGGDSNYNAAPDVARSFNIAKANQTINFGALSDKTFGDADFSVSASASSGLAVGFSASGNCTVSGSTVHITGAGSCTVTASQPGNTNFNAAPDVPQSFQIAKANQTINFGALADVSYGSLDFGVNAAGGASGQPVTFSATGNCTIVNVRMVHLTGAGSCSVTASQAGDSNYNDAASVTQSFTILKASTFIFLSSSANPSSAGQELTFTALVELSRPSLVSAAVMPTGAVQFQVDHNDLSGPANCVPGSGNFCQAGVSTSALTAGTHAITASYGGDANFNSSTVTIGQSVGSDFNFSQTLYTVAERGGSISITVRRTGGTASAASVDYATDDGSTPSVAVPCSAVTGLALERCDYTRSAGTLNFAPGETQKTFTVLINDDSYTEGTETLTLRLSNPAGGVLGGQATATLQIADDQPESTGNPSDDPSFFVRQHYHDFLNREPDQSGLQFWTGGITSCGSDSQCRDVKRVNTSAAFFLSIEFQDTGFLVEKIYKTAYGDATGQSTFPVPHQLPVPVVRLTEFLRDTQEIGSTPAQVIVGQGNWQQQLEDNKNAFALEFVQRQRFADAFPPSLTADRFVRQLDANAGGVLTEADITQLDALFGGPSSPSDDASERAQALRQVAENPLLNAAEKNRAFVLMQFFGYLRRNPNDAQDADYTGYDFWLSKLNQFSGDFVKAEMVKAFITSIEYRQRFGQP
jgi:probable HAF family extracellular repeat protein